jgi:predicted GIY-YIG superfamily endonuclease
MDLIMDVEKKADVKSQELKEFSRHMMYILCNDVNNATYVGYTVDFEKRLRQHNTLLSGGAKFTTKHVLFNNVTWKPLALIQVVNEDFDQRRALSFEWHCRYPNNQRPCPSKYKSPSGRLIGLGLVLNNPKFQDLHSHVQVFTKTHYDSLMNITTSCIDRVSICYS